MIEKATVEKSKAMDWHDRKKATARRSVSTDSLLSMDEGSDSASQGSSVPTLPPKGRFLSTGNLSPPPALPPKQRTSKTNCNLNKRVSISTNAVHIINASSDNEYMTDGSVAERIKTFLNQSKEPLKPLRPLLKTRPRKMVDVPDVVPVQDDQDYDREEQMSKELVIEALPSVKNLATMFSPIKSPEPLPRQSIAKVSSKAQKVLYV